jgi:endo-1,4-beta-xylanase
MKTKNVLTVLLVAFILASCVPVTKVVPTETDIPTLTFTPEPTATIMPTSIPTLESFSGVPYPNTKLIESVIKPFVSAMKTADIELDSTKLATEVKYQEVTDVNGKPFVIATVFVNSDSINQGEPFEGFYPLLIASQSQDKKWIWGEADLITMAHLHNMSISSFAIDFQRKADSLKIIDTIVSESGIDADIVFAKFTVNDWKKILQNWDNVKAQIDQSQIPDGYSYDWSGGDATVQFAKQNNLSIRVQHLVWGDDVPQSLYDGKFSKDEILKLLEFSVKVRVIKYPEVETWDVVDEYVAATLFHNGRWNWGFYPTRFKADYIIPQVANWVKAVNPNARLVLVEDYGLEPAYSKISDNLISLLKQLKNQNVPIDGVVIENNMWIYDPPSYEKMVATLLEIKGMGYEITSSEMTVPITDKFPLWAERKQSAKIDNKSAAQALLYYNVVKAYLEAGATGFGFGGITDAHNWYDYIGVRDTQALILDKTYQPKPAYYLIVRAFYEQLP